MTTPPLRTAGISAARDYQDLPAWTRAMALAERIYAATEDFPERELNGLAASMRTNAVAVASHIATASARTEYGIVESYSKSQSALAELATQIELAGRLGYVADKLTAEIDEVGRLLIGLKHGLKTEAKATARAERETTTRDREFAERKPREGATRREFKPRERSDGATSREERQYKPRGEFKPREDRGGERPARAYTPRDGAAGEERPRREYKPRDAGDRKPYGDKKPYEKKAYGDKKPYGDRKPSGDRKPYGDKKPYGGKPAGDRPYRKPRD